ncbi:MAG: gluconokinase [Rhodospirillales bacterium]|nr:gluconokinase [Rhodospirillales bacterium]MDE2199412.1 gluconokinase [Rhodospirillales bacterium]MDE2574241.1 gluconokinase [Rhodospirillales bacterium]
MTMLVVMGVSGSGKTTVARMLAAELGWVWQDGDDLHPPANVAKMAGGEPLSDADRWPWLAAIAARLAQWRAEGRSGIITCSALKRAYREALADGQGDTSFIHLRGSKALIAARLAERRGHFMPPGLLDSQFAALEAPAAEEPALAFDIDAPPAAIVRTILAALPLRA